MHIYCQGIREAPKICKSNLCTHVTKLVCQCGGPALATYKTWYNAKYLNNDAIMCAQATPVVELVPCPTIGLVVGLYLEGFNLTGQLPASLGTYLTDLVHVHLSNNPGMRALLIRVASAFYLRVLGEKAIACTEH